MNDRLLKKSRRLRGSVLSFIGGEEAPAAVEYAIMAGLIGAVIVLAVTTLGIKILGLFQSFTTEFPP